ncbi:MAG: hypothetical protein NTX31_00245 [Burkholderiales bacterium]|nr:hypothetical protein [Burkholderiales bacterium]
MNTNRTTRFAGLLLAVLMTVGINSALLWQFDVVAHEGVTATSGQVPVVAKLETVTIVAHRS